MKKLYDICVQHCVQGIAGVWEDVLLLRKLWNRKTELWQDQIPIYTQVFCKVHNTEKIGYRNCFRFWFKKSACVSAGSVSLQTLPIPCECQNNCFEI